MATEKNLNIIIFGASGTIGKFLLEKYYKKKCNLLLFIKNREKINFFKKKYKSNKFQKIFFEKLDVNNTLELKKKILKNKKFIRKTNILINTIGIQGEINNFFKLNLKNFRKTFEINFMSHIFILRFIYELVKNSKNMLIIFFSGGGVTNVRQNFSSYSLSKIILVKLVEIISLEFKNKKVRINAISPGVINSKMTQLILRNNKKVKIDEIKKIKKEFKNSMKNLKKIYDLIELLYSKRGKKISGKIISSRWDKFQKWSFEDINKIADSDIFTLKRIIN